VLEQSSGLKCGSDFNVAYSPERINPGDKQHRVETIQKVVAAQDERTLDVVAEVYGSVVTAGVYRATNTKTAEAAKVIENRQRGSPVGPRYLGGLFERFVCPRPAGFPL
jgi:UDP-N-acetyl-D-glucosamine/UDP-N-acetyl-D-galactosamine dehydrogenase